MLKRGFLKVDSLKLLIVDEADEIWSRGFQEQIKKIFKLIPLDIQIALFSGTMQPEITSFIEESIKDPTTILVRRQELTLNHVKQYYIAIDREEWKFDTLVEQILELIYSKHHNQIRQCIIYCNSKLKVHWLTTRLKGKNLNFTLASIVFNLISNTILSNLLA